MRDFGELAVEPLIALLDLRKERVHDGGNKSLSNYIIRTLGEIGDARAVEPLIGVLEDDQFNSLDLEAEYALKKLGHDATWKVK